MKELFLDANAHLPMSHHVMDFYHKFNDSIAGHGHPLSPSATGRAAQNAIEEARSKIAKLINAKDPNQIVFTSGCTQACEWGAQLLAHMVRMSGDDEVFISPIEHPAINTAVDAAFDSVLIKKLKVNSDGEVLFESAKNIVCIHMQNEIGTIQNINSTNDNYIFTDMSQSLGKIKVDISKLNPDIAVFGAHKFGGPGGVGFMYLSDSSVWREFGVGSRYFRDISGTPNTAGIASSAVALEEAINTFDERYANMIEFRDVLEPELKTLGFDIIGENANRCPNTTYAKTPKDGDAFRLLNLLGNDGIYCGLGSACGSLYSGGSPLMEALGRPSDGQDYLRISHWGEYRSHDVEYFINKLRKIL